MTIDDYRLSKILKDLICPVVEDFITSFMLKACVPLENAEMHNKILEIV